MDNWLGKVRGHVGEQKGRFETDRREREAAGRAPADKNIILTEREVQGEWDAGRVLFTTLGGQARPITADDLAAFRQNMRQAERRFKGGKGITARQVIDLASSTPLRYVSPGQPSSDIDKARREITMAAPVSALNGTIRFMTNAGPDSKVSRHHVVVNLHEFEGAAAQLAAASRKDGKTPKQVASWLRKQNLSFDCDCERHRYFFRYVATIGGFAAGRKETGYPKIRNPRLMGVACKHVLRVMTELESSTAVLRFLEKHLASVSEYKARTQLTQMEAEDALKARTPARIKTSEQRAAEAARVREKRALARSVKQASAKRPSRAAPATRRSTKSAAATLGSQFGMTPDQVLALLAQHAKKG